MKLGNKKLMLLLTVSLIIIYSPVAFASGLGVVDFDFLATSHYAFAAAQKSYQDDVIKYRKEFDKSAAKKNEQEKKQMVEKYNELLNLRKNELFAPIDKDIFKQIELVSNEKGLDYVVVKGYVLQGESIDITKEVVERISKLSN